MLKHRNTPKSRWLIVSGFNIYCDQCKEVLDIPGGYYTCDNSCNWDLCTKCYTAMAAGSELPKAGSEIGGFVKATIGEASMVFGKYKQHREDKREEKKAQR